MNERNTPPTKGRLKQRAELFQYPLAPTSRRRQRATWQERVCKRSDGRPLRPTERAALSPPPPLRRRAHHAVATPMHAVACHAYACLERRSVHVATAHSSLTLSLLCFNSLSSQLLTGHRPPVKVFNCAEHQRLKCVRCTPRPPRHHRGTRPAQKMNRAACLPFGRSCKSSTSRIPSSYPR